MSRDSAIIKFRYENHKEYEDHAAGNRKQSVSFAREPNTLLIDREQHRLLRGICGANTKQVRFSTYVKKFC